MYLYPYEYLSMVCNAKLRDGIIGDRAERNPGRERGEAREKGTGVPRGATAGPAKF